MLKFGLGLCVALSLGLLTGCGSKSAPVGSASISGRVTYNNKPVGGGTIVFHAKEGKGSYPSPLSKDGTYEITGLPPGPMVITVETESANPQRKSTNYPGGGGKGAKVDSEYAAAMAKMGGPAKGAAPTGEYVRIPAKYNNARTSPLSITIEEGRNVKEWPLAD
jgi:hypothetical protein